jgi:hypothetical protein
MSRQGADGLLLVTAFLWGVAAVGVKPLFGPKSLSGAK